MNDINTNPDILQSLGISSRQISTKDDKKLGQEDFLALMIAQIQNQDPFEPLDNGEFLSQIAQFSTVTGIQDLQESFASLASSLTSNQALQASALVGRDVLVRSDVGALSAGGTLQGAIVLPASTDTATIKITSQAGELIRELPLGAQRAGTLEFAWDGLLEDGSKVAPGVYKITATARIDGEDVALPTLILDRVDSVTLGKPGEGTILNLAALGATDFENIQEIR